MLLDDQSMKPILSWAAKAMDPGAKVVSVQALRKNAGDRGPWLLRITHRRGTTEAVLKTGPAEASAYRIMAVKMRDAFACEVAGLTFAEEHGIAAPQLLAADLDGTETGVLAILSTALPGSHHAPNVTSLRNLGAAAAKLHDIPLSPQPDLPLRTRPRQGEDFVTERRWAAQYQAASKCEQEAILAKVLSQRPGWSVDTAKDKLLKIRTTPLIRAAEEQLKQFQVPVNQTLFVHGDLSIGNAVWNNSAVIGIIDWEGAGAGHYGIDLGDLRFEGSLHFGLRAADEALEGWQQAAGQKAEDVAYWDLVAALNTPASLARWAATVPGATERRDEFIRAALIQLDKA